MRRIALVTAVSLLFINTSFSYDTKGKFGMGIKMVGTPLVLFSNMKIGITNLFGLEPSIGFHQFTMRRTDSIAVYDPITGVYIGMEEYENSMKYNIFIVSNMFDFKVIRTEKSNFIIRPGVGYYLAKEKFEDYDNDFSEYQWLLSVKGGVGIEHFFTDYFSVYAGFMCSYNLISSSEDYWDYAALTSVGNQFAELSFVWYLK
jgi:hypothetical protein